jgi:hypothetical protein
MEPDSMELMPLAPPGPVATPWVDRAVKSPAIRSGYLSIAAHLLVGILLALLAFEKKTEPRLRPLVFSIGPQTQDEAGDPLVAMEIGAANEAAASDTAADTAQPEAVASPAAGEPPLVAVAEPVPVIDPLADLTAVEEAPSDPAASAPLAAGPIAQPVSARGGPPRSAAAGGRAAALPMANPSPPARAPPALRRSVAAAGTPRARRPSSGALSGCRCIRPSTVPGNST